MEPTERDPADPAAVLGPAQPDAPVDEIAAMVRSRRKSHGWSMRELAKRAGVSQPFVSKLENGQLLPSLPTLYALASALGTNPSNLLPSIGKQSATDGVHIPHTGSPSDSPVRIMAGGPETSTQVYLFELRAGAGDSEYFQHGGEEIAYVIEGEVTSEYSDGTAKRAPVGTALTIDPATPHRWTNNSTAPCTFLLICAAPLDV
jgi:quercetin dioxygenase-like cupin family protein/lambda repressor-like predicted transcriptional regulator